MPDEEVGGHVAVDNSHTDTLRFGEDHEATIYGYRWRTHKVVSSFLQNISHYCLL